MFTRVGSPTGHFILDPLPASLFEFPPAFGGAALLRLVRFDNNSAALRPEHLQGIAIAAQQAGGQMQACECYGVTDRSGSEELNRALSSRRAQTALTSLTSALGLTEARVTFANGLGERFAAEYFAMADNQREGGFRGVACYLWESFAVATDPFLKISVSFASPPDGGGGQSKILLSPLHMGRLRAQPRSPFA